MWFIIVITLYITIIYLDYSRLINMIREQKNVLFKTLQILKTNAKVLFWVILRCFSYKKMYTNYANIIFKLIVHHIEYGAIEV